jgi:Pyruvate/2-oxoacid:ferredoxin oxidoreductase delta subunit
LTYARVLVHWFSGTGNALTVARWIAEDAREAGLPVALLPMQGVDRPRLAPADGRTLHCFCFPTHGFAPPWLVLRYLWRFPDAKGSDAFFLNTRAGVRLPFLFVPGLSGLALWWPILLFALRGVRIAGSLPADMPHNWVSFFPPNPRWGIERLVPRTRRILRRATSRLFAGRRYHRWSVWLTLPLDALIAPGSVLYVAVGRFGLAKTLFASRACTACGLCVVHCPVGAIAMIDGRPFWKVTCESCMRCMSFCPRRSVQSWVTRMLLLTWGLLAVGQWIWPLPTSLWLLLITPAYVPVYRLLHVAWGSRFVNAAFTWTSLTRWWSRYAAPGIAVKDLDPTRDM